MYGVLLLLFLVYAMHNYSVMAFAWLFVAFGGRRCRGTSAMRSLTEASRRHIAAAAAPSVAGGGGEQRRSCGEHKCYIWRHDIYYVDRGTKRGCLSPGISYTHTYILMVWQLWPAGAVAGTGATVGS